MNIEKWKNSYLLIVLCSLFILSAILLIKENSMPQAQTMTLDEKLALSNKACILRQAGDEEGYDRLMRRLNLVRIGLVDSIYKAVINSLLLALCPFLISHFSFLIRLNPHQQLRPVLYSQFG
ncbi:MAG: hypothetical protein LBI14_02220, partial [Treponema sp.]|nr:hypothetical protein [Treponema sp.]